MSQFTDAVEHAVIAFFASLAEDYPDIKTGDLEPHDSVTFNGAATAVVQQWIHANTPDPLLQSREISAEDQEAWMTEYYSRIPHIVEGWGKDYDRCGAICWCHPDPLSECRVHATPFWDGEKCIAVQFTDDKGRCAEPIKLPFSVDYNATEYVESIRHILRKYRGDS